VRDDEFTTQKKGPLAAKAKPQESSFWLSVRDRDGFTKLADAHCKSQLLPESGVSGVQFGVAVKNGTVS